MGSLCSSSPSGTTTATVSSDPWSGQQPYLQTGFQQADIGRQDPKQFYPGSTVVPFAPQTEAALTGAEQQAGQTGLLQQGAGELSKTLGGDYLSAGNPYFTGMMDRIQRDVQPRVASTFARGGRYGSAGQNEAMTRAMTDAASQLAFSQYQPERARMAQAATQAPGMYQAGFLPSDKMREIGQAREAQAGAELQEQMNRFNFAQDEPGDRLREFMSLVKGGSYGGTQTSTEPIYSQPLTQGLGAATTVAGLGKEFGWW